MIQDNIMRMAREAGLDVRPGRDGPLDIWATESSIERFAALVVANTPPDSSMAYQEGYEVGAMSEREECAKVCDVLRGYHGDVCAAAIRARGEK